MKRDETPDENARPWVLVIDDDAVMRLLLAHLLQAGACRVDVAASVEQGIARLAGRRYELIVVDGHLPDGSGGLVAHAVRSDVRLRRIPIIAISSDDSPEHVQHLLKSGADQFVPKPITAQKIRQILETYPIPPTGRHGTL